MKVYKNITTREVVEEIDAEDYVFEKLGIQIKPVGPNGEFTLDQAEFIENTVDWFFSGNWVEEQIKEEDGDIFALINEECECDERY